jgi:hypothetical protein
VVPIPSFQQFIGGDGVFRPNDPMLDGTTEMLDELRRWAIALKTMRSETAA